MAFTCLLSWLPIWLRSEVVDPCFIHFHIFTQKNLLIALKQLPINVWIVVVLLFLIRHPLWTQLSHWQMSMQSGEYIAFWYLQLLCYLTQLQFTTGQNAFVEFFDVFRDNCRIWATWTLSIICVCTSAFKVSIQPLMHSFRRSRVWITLIKPLLYLKSIFPINTRKSDFSNVLKICNCSFT